MVAALIRQHAIDSVCAQMDPFFLTLDERAEFRAWAEQLSPKALTTFKRLDVDARDRVYAAAQRLGVVPSPPDAGDPFWNPGYLLGSSNVGG